MQHVLRNENQMQPVQSELQKASGDFFFCTKVLFSFWENGVIADFVALFENYTQSYLQNCIYIHAFAKSFLKWHSEPAALVSSAFSPSKCFFKLNNVYFLQSVFSTFPNRTIAFNIIVVNEFLQKRFDYFAFWRIQKLNRRLLSA